MTVDPSIDATVVTQDDEVKGDTPDQEVDTFALQEYTGHLPE